MTTTAANDAAILAFATSCFNVVQDMGLAFAGEPDEKVESALQDYAARLRTGLATTLSQCTAEQVGQIVDALLDGIRFRRRQIETGIPGIG